MAEGGRDKHSLICGICLEQYKEPKILPCSHTFCLACLEKTLKKNKTETAPPVVHNTLLALGEPKSQKEDDLLVEVKLEKNLNISHKEDDHLLQIEATEADLLVNTGETYYAKQDHKPSYARELCREEQQTNTERNYEKMGTLPAQVAEYPWLPPSESVGEQQCILEESDSEESDCEVTGITLEVHGIGSLNKSVEDNLETSACTTGIESKSQLQCFEPISSVKEFKCAQASSTVQRITVKCAVCVREHVVPQGDVDQFETDYEAAQAVQFELLQKSVSKPQECGSCGEAKKLVDHCDECDSSICKECSVLHKRLAAFANHKVVPLGDLTPEDYHSRRKKTHMCSRHTSEAVTYYCTSCCVLICHKCFYKDHRMKSHSVLDLEEADRKLTLEVTMLSSKAKDTHQRFQRYSEYVRKVELDVIDGEYTNGLKRKINEVFDEQIQRLQEERESILKKVEDHDSTSKKEVWAAKDVIKTTMSNLEAGLRFTEKAQRCANPADRISMNSESSKILASASKAEWSSQSLPRPLVISTVPNIPRQSTCGTLVELTSNDVKISHVTNNEYFLMNAKVGRQVQIEIELQVNTVLLPTFQILYGKSQKAFDPIVTYETEESFWNITFVPRCSGRHCVQVWIGGIEIASKDIDVSGSPRLGAKVKPGPDWIPPDHTNLYHEGTVMIHRLKAHKHKVRVGWNQGTCNPDPNQNKIQDVAPDYLEKERSTRQILVQSRLQNVETCKFQEYLSLPGKKRDDDNVVCKEHTWGGPEGLYEVELVL